MATYKALIVMSIVLLLDMRPRTVSAEPVQSGDSKCECGVFKFPTAETTKELPLISKALQFNFECNADGKESCSNMCKALSTASKEKGPSQICEIIKDTETPYVPVIYYRACEDDYWTFTGLKSSLNICCNAKEPVACE